MTTAAPQKTTQFSSRVVPWMKLGQIVDGTVTAAEAAKLGGIDFKVAERPLYFRTNGKDSTYRRIDERKVLVHEDTNQWLGIVSKDYPVVQYGEAFDFMEAVGVRFVAAGGLRGGRQGFMVVETDVQFSTDFLPDDDQKLYGVLRTSHDCSRSIEVMVMPLRGRCMNQLTLRSFAKNVPHRWSVVHAGDVKSKLAAARASIGKLDDYAKSFESNARRLIETKVTDDVAQTILKYVLPDRPKRPQVIESIIAGWHERTATNGYDGTGWGLVNAVSEYFEWDRALGSPESRFLAALQGQTHNAINKTAGYILTRV